MMPFPAIGKNTRLDDLFDDEGRPKASICVILPSAFDKAVGTPTNFAFNKEIRNRFSVR
jgi:hypothetical protein